MRDERRDECIDFTSALLWLNDRLGQVLAVELALADGDLPVVYGEGILRHWSEASDLWSYAHARDDFVGSYAAGETHFDLTAFGDAAIWRHEDELCLELAHGVTLRLVQQNCRSSVEPDDSTA